MKIGELARAAQCSVETIRYYEKEGLLPAPLRTDGNYRDYGPGHIERLRFIRNCRALDMAQEEIRQLLPQDLRNWQHDELITALQQKVAEIEALQQRLEANRQHLQQLIALINDRPDDIDCQDNAARVLASMGIASAQ